jgi:chitodextrinase
MRRGFMRSCIVFIVLLSMLAQPCGAVTVSQRETLAEAGSYYAAATGADAEKPSAPTALTVVARTHTSVSISWTKSRDNKEVKGYEVYTDGKKAASAAKTDYTIRGLVPGKEYAFTVKACDTSGNLSDSSAALWAETLKDSQKPTTPDGLSAVSSTYTSISLKWNPSSDNIRLKGYEIYCDGEKKGSATIEYYECKGLEPGREYTFFVKACDIAGNYSYQSSRIYIATPPDNSAPSVPEGLKAAERTETDIKLEWSASSDNVKVKQYEIYCDGTRKGKISKPAYTCKGLIPGKSYVFTIKALDSTGNSSALSKALKVTTVSDAKAPTAPADLTVKSVKESTVALEWTASTDNVKVKGYKIYCNGTEIETSSRPKRSVRVAKGIGINIIWIRAYDVSGNLSPASKSVTIIG